MEENSGDAFRPAVPALPSPTHPGDDDEGDEGGGEDAFDGNAMGSFVPANGIRILPEMKGPVAAASGGRRVRRRPAPVLAAGMMGSGGGGESVLGSSFTLSASGTFSQADMAINRSGLSVAAEAMGELQADGHRWKVMLEDLEMGHALGHGAHGVVRAAIHRPTGTAVAVKSVALHVAEDVDRRLVVKEIRTLYRVSHPNVVRFLDAFLVEGTVHLVMEQMTAGTLGGLMAAVSASGERFPERMAAYVVLQVVLALRYLHVERRIVHRDLTPGNVLLGRADGAVKLGDFGVSGELGNSFSGATSFVGTMAYMSPERIQGQPHATASDVWSLGVMAYELVTGRYPYAASADSPSSSSGGGGGGGGGGIAGFWEIADRVVDGDSPVLDAGVYGRAAADFIAVTLVKDPSQRASAATLLGHPFCADGARVLPEDMALWLSQMVPE